MGSGRVSHEVYVAALPLGGTGNGMGNLRGGSWRGNGGGVKERALMGGGSARSHNTTDIPTRTGQGGQQRNRVPLDTCEVAPC